MSGQDGTAFLSSMRISIFCSGVNNLTVANLFAIAETF